MTADDREYIHTTCPRDCYDGCGITVMKQNGAIRQVSGNADHPSTRGPLCPKCTAAYNHAWIEEDSRLLYPLRRTGAKGSGEFDRISWDEALTEIANRVGEIRDGAGAEKIFHTHYTGTCSLVANQFPGRFFRHIGATEVEPDTVCNNAGHVAWRYVFGHSAHGFDPRTAKDSECILVWGANPSATAPHVDKLWLKEHDAKVIVVDPVAHETARQADLHLQVRPGSDAALAFGLLHVMRREGLLDQDFIRDRVLGYDEVAAEIERCDPAWTEEKTGVPAALIEEAATLYGAGPSLMWLGQGLQRQTGGGNIFRACAMLPAFTGNIGKPGAGAYYLNGTFAIGLRKGASPDPMPPGGAAGVSHMDLPDLLNDPAATSAFFVWNCNPVASNPDQSKTIQGLKREDLFTVVVDCFPTDTAKYADIVLPAASFLEFDDLCASYFHLRIGPQVKCAEPMGEALPNQEIFRRLSRAMKLEDPALYESDRSIVDGMLGKLDLGVDWSELKERAWMPLSEEPMILWQDLKFATPSGKIEIASKRAVRDGHPLAPVPAADPQPGDGALRLLSPADVNLMNSSYGNEVRVQRLLGPARASIHPADAAAREIADGDRICLSNEAGELTLTALVTESVPAGTVLASKSRWPGQEPENRNVNVLHIPRKTDMGESTSVHSTTVHVAKA